MLHPQKTLNPWLYSYSKLPSSYPNWCFYQLSSSSLIAKLSVSPPRMHTHMQPKMFLLWKYHLSCEHPTEELIFLYRNRKKISRCPVLPLSQTVLHLLWISLFISLFSSRVYLPIYGKHCMHLLKWALVHKGLWHLKAPQDSFLLLLPFRPSGILLPLYLYGVGLFPPVSSQC